MTKTKIFRTIPELCTGCDICALMCSLAKTGTINPHQARIKVVHSSENGSCYPIICRHCKVPLCQKACPVEGAMYLDDRTGAVVINEAKCIGCLACMEACPFEAIQVGPGKEVLKCDLCGGDPVCVKYCPQRPAQHFPHLPYPKASCLEYVEPYRVTRKVVKARAHAEVKSAQSDPKD